MPFSVLVTEFLPSRIDASALASFSRAMACDLVAASRIVEVTDRRNLLVRDIAFWRRGTSLPMQVPWEELDREDRTRVANKSFLDLATCLPPRDHMDLKIGSRFEVIAIKGAAIIDVGGHLTGFLPDGHSAHDRLASRAELTAILPLWSAMREADRGRATIPTRSRRRAPALSHAAPD